MRLLFRFPCFLSILLVAASGTINAAKAPLTLPSLKVGKGNNRTDLELRELSVQVELVGHLSETIFELEFYNQTNRQQEGEFTLQLPEGATVSTYALEVNGRMREAVAVDKAQARNAYESIKRQMIDPGLVEREKNNIYRTRIFPIPALKTKRVRIGFLHHSEGNGSYKLELKRTQSVREFTCNVEGASEEVILQNEGLQPDKEPNTWKGRNITLNTTLQARAAIPDQKNPVLVQSVAQTDGSRHIIAQVLHQPTRKEEQDQKEEWKHIRVIWDNSYSGRLRHHAEEIKALQKIATWLGDFTVSVQLLSNKLTEPEQFEIESGNLEAVATYLKKCHYNGATNYRLLEDSGLPTLLITDGQLSTPSWAPSRETFFHSLILFGTGMSTENPLLLQAASREIDIRTENWIEHLRSSDGSIHLNGLSTDDWDIEKGTNHFLLTARLPAEFGSSLTIQPPNGKRITLTKSQLTPKRTEEWNLARRAWAQNRLSSLEWLHRNEEAKRHAIAERLVSDDTSVIVLERFEDHIRYRIPPPEPDLLRRYEQTLERNEFLSHRNARALWDEKLEWYNTPKEWLDGDLSQQVSAAAIFVKASRAAFPEKKQNKETLAKFEKWITKASKVVSGKGTINSQKVFENWKQDLAETQKELEALHELRSHSDDEMIHVSVRGFVHKRGIYSATKFLSLRDAIERAGGPTPFGSYSRVYLYRNGQRTGYNLKSNQAGEIVLQNGDMVVVESRPSQYDFLSGSDGFSDPFSAPAADPFFSEPDPRRFGPAIFEEAGAGGAPTVPGIEIPRFPNPAELSGQKSVEIIFGEEPPALPTDADEEFLADLQSSEDMVAALHKSLTLSDGDEGVFTHNFSVATIIETARLLYRKNEDEAAYTMITNLAEVGMNPIEAARTISYWLNDFGKTDEAIKLLESLARSVTDSSSRALVNFDIGRISERTDAFYQTFLEETSRDATPLLTMALTDYYGREGEKTGELFHFRKHDFPSDIRIVITTIGGSASLDLTIPYPDYSPEKNGGRTELHDRVTEFMMRNAFPGDHEISLIRWDGSTTTTTAFAQYYLNWGRENETVLQETILLEKPKTKLNGFRFGW